MDENQKSGDERPTLKRMLGDLPSIPGVISRMMLLDRNSERFFEDLIDLLENDPGFALRCLRLANSTTFAPVSQIVTLKAAVSRLGTEAIVERLSTLAVTQAMQPTTEEQRELWQHSIQTALAARLIVQKSRVALPEVGYLSGLLHDIGRFLMLRNGPSGLEGFFESGWKDPAALSAAEREVYGYDHAELGGKACEEWSIPTQITTVVRHHHASLGKSSALNAEEKKLVAAVKIADALSMLVMHEDSFADANPSVRRTVLSRRCLEGTNGLVTVEDLELILPTMVVQGDAAVRGFAYKAPPPKRRRSA